jgi:cytochrome c-type biogenesis protein CcmH
MNKKIVITSLLLTLVLAGLRINQGLAQDTQPVTDDQINEVARQLYCPVCENISLDVCPTQACAQWRDLIKEKLEAGWTTAEIKDYFATQYGDRVLPEPPKRGLNWLVYILPPVMIIGSVMLLWWIVNRLRAPKRVSNPSMERVNSASSGDEYVARIEEELKNRKG